jgi:medium-chain acyl-[acyl-carrier-protein] hydrolase
MAQPWISFSKTQTPMMKLFCVPYSGGGAQVYMPFAPLLPPAMALYALELPGRGRRFTDKLLESVSSMVREAVDGILPLIGGSPAYAVFGHSLGGIVAFETVRELRRRKAPMPRHLFVSGVRAPQVPKREGTAYDLPHDQFVQKLVEMGGTQEEILANREMLELMVPILRMDFKAYETYRYTEDRPLECPVTALGGSLDTFVLPADVEQWSLHTGGAFAHTTLDGGHFFIHPRMKDVTDIIRSKVMAPRP